MSLKKLVKTLKTKMDRQYDAYLKTRKELEEKEDEYRKTLPICEYCKKPVEKPCIKKENTAELTKCKWYNKWLRKFP